MEEMNASGIGENVQPQEETGFPQSADFSQNFVGGRSGDKTGGSFGGVSQNGAGGVRRDVDASTGEVVQPQNEIGADAENVPGSTTEQEAAGGVGNASPQEESNGQEASQDDGQENGANEVRPGNEQGFKTYATQQEWQADVDRIIGKRLGDMRGLKEQASAYQQLTTQLQELFGAASADEAVELFSQQYAETMAAQQGITPEQFREHQELAQKARQFDEMQKEQQIRMQNQQKLSVIDAQVNALRAKNPEFDMGKEVENPEFCRMVWNQGISVEDAYYLTHKDALYKQAQNAVMENIAAKQGRIPENGTGKVPPTVNKINPEKLSFSEIDDILERVRKGEQIQF